VKRGEIRWYTFRLPDKRRPVLVLTRDDVIDSLNEIIVEPATRTIRGLTTAQGLNCFQAPPAPRPHDTTSTLCRLGGNIDLSEKPKRC
jgi:hypothetical protein